MPPKNDNVSSTQFRWIIGLMCATSVTMFGLAFRTFASQESVRAIESKSDLSRTSIERRLDRILVKQDRLEQRFIELIESK